MNILLIGYGKMGKAVEKIAINRGHLIIDRTSSTTPLSKEALEKSDVCIDFSHSKNVLTHIQMAAEHQVPIVIGTTGWDKELDIAKEFVQKYNSSALFSPNFSLGVALFISLIQKAKKLFSEFDVTGVEWHHSQKLDAPSGTAKKIHGRCSIPFTSIRVGSIFGKHEVLFDSPQETIVLSHEAKNREGFASGALDAAEWILGKKGWFTIDDMLHSLNYSL